MNDSGIQVPPVLYMAQRLPIGSGHIIDAPKIRTVIIHTCTWQCERDSKGGGGHCSAECVDSSII